MIHTAAYFAAALDPIITFIILVVASGVITFLKNKGMIKGMEQPKPDDPGRPTTTQAPRRPMAPPTQAPRPVATSWEAELRRLLEGEQSAPPPVRPRPVVVAQPPSATPSVVRPVIRPVLLDPDPMVIPRLVPARMPPPVAPVAVSARGLAPMPELKRAYETAGPPAAPVAGQTDRAPWQQAAATAVIRRPVSAEVTQVVAMFQNARTARQAVIASIIFSSPTGLTTYD